MNNKILKGGTGLLCCWLLAACDVSTEDNRDSGAGQPPDPVVVDLPIAYVARSLPVDENGTFAADRLLDPAAFNPGARLILRARAQASAPETDITTQAFLPPPQEEVVADAAAIQPLYDVKDLEVSSDGNKLIFAMRAPEDENASADEQPTWNIWEYDRQAEQLRRVITSDINAEQGEDVAPAYLPDGRIAFSSTRQRRTRAILLDENKPQYAGLTEDGQQEAFVLHVMDEDGQNIQQITYNQSHDLHPTVLDDGRIAFLRWDNAANRDRVSLYTVNPDGTGVALLYGYHSQNTGTGDTEVMFSNPRQLPDSRLLVTLKHRESQRWGGELVAINTADFTDNNQPTANNAGLNGPAQEAISALPVRLDEQLSRHGYFNSAAPLFDGTDRLLVSWSQCRLISRDTGRPTFCSDELPATAPAQEADPLYSLWVYNPAQQTQLPVVVAEEGVMYTDPVVLAPRPFANHRPAAACDADCESAGVGVVHIRSVYDFGGETIRDVSISAMADPALTPTAERPARFLRLIKPVSRPDNDLLDTPFNTARGFSGNQQMREILGYVPIEPDGSVKFKVPADVAFAIEVLDAKGRRVGGAFRDLGNRHQNWLTVKAGEVRECNGCHTADSTIPHGRPDAEPPSANPGAPATGMGFPNTQLRDEFGTPQPQPQAGETMAEYHARVHHSAAHAATFAGRTPSIDLVFEDEWAEAANAADAFSLTYADVAALFEPESFEPQDPDAEGSEAPQWRPPTQNCEPWNALCRVVIHYPRHIQPLWEVSRPVFDEAGNLVGDNRCTRCHSERDEMGVLSVPPGQLELTRTSTFSPNNNYMTSYAELLRGDNALVEDGGQLIDELVETGDYERDEDGEWLLDDNGDPIPVLRTVPVTASMSVNGARHSNRFFSLFDEPPDNTGEFDHPGLLNASELRLIAEWLDIGGQYYNNPFAVQAE